MRSTIADLRRFARRLLGSPAAVKREGTQFDSLARLHAQYGRDGAAPPVLCFGDSVLERVAREDADQRTLGAMLEHELPAIAISHSAFQPQVYRQLLRAVQVMPRRPSVLVVPINIRCFSPQWDFHPEFQFERELAALERYIADPSDAAANVSIEFRPTDADREAYARRPVEYPGSSCKTIGDFIAIRDASPDTERARRLATIFEFHYMHPLEREHRKLRDLVAVTSLSRDLGLRTLFYLTPINHEAGVRHCGAAFAERYAANASIVRELVELADLGQLVPSTEFIHPDIANEHLNQSGRARLAGEIVTRVRGLLG